MSEKQPLTNKRYVSISEEELKALGKVSGEAVRLYLAIASFAWGEDYEVYPRWEKIEAKLGKRLDGTRGRKLARQLEEVGLLERFKKNRKRWFRLPWKQAVIQERWIEREGEKVPARGHFVPSQRRNFNTGKIGKKVPSIKNSINHSNEEYSNNERMPEVSSERIELENGEMDWKELVDLLVMAPDGINVFSEGDRSLILQKMKEKKYYELIKLCWRPMS